LSYSDYAILTVSDTGVRQFKSAYSTAMARPDVVVVVSPASGSTMINIDCFWLYLCIGIINTSIL